MKALFYSSAAFVGTALCSPAAVTLGFDSDEEGFVIQSNGTSIGQSAVNGGSLQIDAAGGWAGNSAQLAVQSNAALWAELQSASANGGTLTFDIVVQEADQDFTVTSPTIDYPNWFEVVVVANSRNPTNGGIGGWDSETLAFGLGEAQWPLAGGTMTHTFSIPITGGPLVGADGGLAFDVSHGWSNLHLGLNNDGGALNDATVYFDNITITAIPEPSGFALIGMAALGLGLRRRRG